VEAVLTAMHEFDPPKHRDATAYIEAIARGLDVLALA
jgi:hypothetical protein